MKIEVEIKKGPTKGPTYFEVRMSKRRYSNPKLFIPKDEKGKPVLDPARPWYVWFYWRTDPEGKLDRKMKFKKSINRQDTVRARKAIGKALAETYRDALGRGWHPLTKKMGSKPGGINFVTLEAAIKKAYQVKVKAKKKGPTLIGYEFHMNRFLEWAGKFGYKGLDVHKFSIDHFYEFLDWLRFEYIMENGESLSGSSINNHKASLSALFTTMKNERLIPVNFVRDIPKVDEEVVNNRAFTVDDIQKIKKELEKEDPYLIPFISFILYPLLRPREICRLQVKDVNGDDGYFSVETKTDVLSIRRIIQKQKPTIQAMKLEKEPDSFFLFTNKNRPADWDVPLKSKVDHFGVRFRKIKTKLGYGREYGLYSFRHTAILDLYNSMVDQGKGEQEILFKLMPITQHKSVAGIKNYLRHHRKSIPADHSDIYTLDF